MRWSSSKDEDVGTVAELTVLLEEILMEEHELDCCDDLPDAAVVPTMRRKSFKELGTPTAQAKELAVHSCGWLLARESGRCCALCVDSTDPLSTKAQSRVSQSSQFRLSSHPKYGTTTQVQVIIPNMEHRLIWRVVWCHGRY